VSGLVVVCGRTQDQPEDDVLRALRESERVTVGRVEVAGRIPIVLDTETDDEQRAGLRWLRELPGVALVEMAYADYRTPAETSEDHIDAD
jgi:nitrate reductase NapAB chaperone NapD